MKLLVGLFRPVCGKSLPQVSLNYILSHISHSFSTIFLLFFAQKWVRWPLASKRSCLGVNFWPGIDLRLFLLQSILNQIKVLKNTNTLRMMIKMSKSVIWFMWEMWCFCGNPPAMHPWKKLQHEWLFQN